MSNAGSGIFREEALEHYRTGYQRQGDVLRLSPAWTQWSFWLLLFILMGALVFMVSASIPEYAEGPAVILFNEQTPVIARRAGIVAKIAVPFDGHLSDDQAGVQAGVQLYYPDAPEGYEVLRVPGGVQVGDVHVRLGQRVSPGDVVFSYFPATAELEVVGILPGQYGSKIARGMPVRFEPAGFRYTYKGLQVRGVDEQVVGPDTVRRYLGPEFADTVPVSGPVVLVHANLEGDADQPPTFESEGHVYEYRHGMQGTVRVQMRSERVIFVVAPWLKALFGDRHG